MSRGEPPRRYDALPEHGRLIVSEAFKAACANLRVNGCHELPTDDRAEALVDALVAYYEECRHD